MYVSTCCAHKLNLPRNELKEKWQIKHDVLCIDTYSKSLTELLDVATRCRNLFYIIQRYINLQGGFDRSGKPLENVTASILLEFNFRKFAARNKFGCNIPACCFMWLIVLSSACWAALPINIKVIERQVLMSGLYRHLRNTSMIQRAGGRENRACSIDTRKNWKA